MSVGTFRGAASTASVQGGSAQGDFCTSPVGGRVRAPRVVKHVEPVYPPLAKAAQVMGSVVLEAVLTEEGKVSNLKVVSGHPLLIGPAMDAARQWEYEPTFLNEIPARVILNITVIFRLQA